MCVHIYLDNNENIIIMIIAPDSPSIDAVPLYSHGMGQLIGIKTTFIEPVSGSHGDLTAGSMHCELATCSWLCVE